MDCRAIAQGFVRVLLHEEKIHLVPRVRLEGIRPAIAALGRMMRTAR